MQPRIYCGMRNPLPQGYDRYGLRYQCLRKGYGACLYHGRLGHGIRRRLFFNNPINRWMLLIIIILFILFVCVIIILRH